MTGRTEPDRESQWCPRRNETGSNYQGPDRWRENIWTLTEEQLLDELEKYASGGTRWRWDWQPRTCSYCGSIHPEDAIKLISEGWEHEKATAKNYKGYLNPPGYKSTIIKIVDSPGLHLPDEHEHWSPVPLVKFYIMHFTESQVRRLNELLK